MLRDEHVQMVFVLDLDLSFLLQRFEVDFDAPRVRPVFGVELAGLEDHGETERCAGVDDFCGERVGHGEGFGDAPAFGARTRRVEVHGVDALVGFVGAVVGCGEHFGVASWLGGGSLGLLRRGLGLGRWFGGSGIARPYDVGLGEIVDVSLGRV